jgi:hypothetical protein
MTQSCRTVDQELTKSCRRVAGTLAGESQQPRQLGFCASTLRTFSFVRCVSDRSRAAATKTTARQRGSPGSMKAFGRRIGDCLGGSVRGNGIRADGGPRSSRVSGPAGPPIDQEASLAPGHQETASQASGPGLPDRIATKEAPVNSVSMVLLHDQGHEPDRKEEPHVPPPPRTPHHRKPPKSPRDASRIQPPSAPHASAASSAPAS